MFDDYKIDSKIFEAIKDNQDLLSLFRFIDFNINLLDKDLNITYSNWHNLDFIPKERRILGEKCYKVFRGLDNICEDCWYGKFNKYTNVIKFIKKSPVDGKFRDFTVISVFDKDEIVGFVQLIRTCTEFVEYQKANRHFISVCSKCKKVKENQNWMSFEEYFLKLGLTFSHGICPDCLKEIYPDYADEILSKKGEYKK